MAGSVDVHDRGALASPPTQTSQWFLSAAERGNDHTTLDRRHRGGDAWSTGNRVQALVHGDVYFRALLKAVQAMGDGDVLMFTDWRGDEDELLDGPGTEVGKVFAEAARRGVSVRGLIWRSHSNLFNFSVRGNRSLGKAIRAAGGQCLLDMRVRPFGSHHQKLVVLRHRGEPERDIAFLGGIDLCHGRGDDSTHLGDPQVETMSAVYGPRPPWHDIQLSVQGPAVGDAETVFRERWEDPAPLSRHPIHVFFEWVHHEDRAARPLPPQFPDPEPCGTHTVQLLRTYPKRRDGYPFAPEGERSIARAYTKALAQARSFVYVEDQYLWSLDVAKVYAEALRRESELRLVVVIPQFPDQDGRISLPPNLAGREPVLRLLKEAGGSRFAVYCLENSEGTPIYVHAKACVIDDLWGCIGSDNANRRSWTHDSELTCAVLDNDPSTPRTWAQSLRLELASGHLGGSVPDDVLTDPIKAYDAFAQAAAALDSWHAGGQRGPRPPGQLRTYTQAPVSGWTRIWANPLYRGFYDPDGRIRSMRRNARF